MEIVPEAAVIGHPLLRLLVYQVRALARNLSGPKATVAEVEGNSLRIASLPVRETLQRRSDALEPELLVDGVHYRQHEPGQETYRSLHRSLRVGRFTYREVAVRNGPTALGSGVTLGYAQGELRRYLERMEAAHRCLLSRSSLERMARAIGSGPLNEAPRIEALLRRAERVPDEARAISMGLDRTAVPTEEDRPENAPPKTDRKERTKPYKPAKPAPVDLNCRMAYVGTISFVDEDTEELVTRRFTALPDAEPDDVAKRMTEGVKDGLWQNGALKLVVVQDGAPEMWNATTRGLGKGGLKKWEEAIDRNQLNERLAVALLMVEPDAGARRKRMSEWNDDLDASEETIDRIQSWLGEQVDKVKDKEVEEKYLGHLVYLENNQARMTYRTLRRDGLPVGSGLTEGARRSVVGQRACGGQRWRPEGTSVVLTLRPFIATNAFRASGASYPRTAANLRTPPPTKERATA